MVQATVLLACCCRRTGQEVRALAWMQQAVASGMPRGFRYVYFEQGADVAEMLYTMVQRGMCAEAASALLADYGTWSSARQAARPVNLLDSQDGITALTDREEDILVLLAQRLTNKEIARRLNVSVFTVRNHTSHIYEKLHVTSRKEAIALAKTLHLLPPT